jgi:hypothetical protein
MAMSQIKVVNKMFAKNNNLIYKKNQFITNGKLIWLICLMNIAICLAIINIVIGFSAYWFSKNYAGVIIVFSVIISILIVRYLNRFQTLKYFKLKEYIIKIIKDINNKFPQIQIKKAVLYKYCGKSIVMRYVKYVIVFEPNDEFMNKAIIEGSEENKIYILYQHHFKSTHDQSDLSDYFNIGLDVHFPEVYKSIPNGINMREWVFYPQPLYDEPLSDQRINGEYINNIEENCSWKFYPISLIFKKIMKRNNY